MTRKEYRLASLSEHEVLKNPFDQFELWYTEASKTNNPEPNAFALASYAANQYPSARMLLMKDFSTAGFIFATNYNSQKGCELAENKRACMLFYWPELERQVRILGDVDKTASDISDKIFASRPRGSQLAAIVSPQSQKLNSRAEFDSLYKNAEQQSAGKDLIRPAFWGAYCLTPIQFEFWQGRENRQHDRIVYQGSHPDWNISRIAP